MMTAWLGGGGDAGFPDNLLKASRNTTWADE
jgi:hypothetical protein